MAYKFLNVNPFDDLYAEDCVTRAICVSTGLNYDAVTNLLNISSALYSCPKLQVSCYSHLLSDILCYPKYYCDNGETVLDITNQFRNKKVIIRIEGHLTAGIYGFVTDSVDCSHEPVDCFWVIE